MRRPWTDRLLALLLIVMITGGGGGLPVLDALIYHSRGSATEDWRAHYEANSGCHADGCAIKSTAQHARSATGVGTPRELAPSVDLALSALNLPSLRSRAPHGQPLSRAPPSFG